LNYRRPVQGDICVSIAGVAVNFSIAVLMILLVNIVHLVSPNPSGTLGAYVLVQVALLNIVLAIFNLIPIPPLDGSHLFKYLLPRELRRGYEKLGRSGLGFIVLILVINMPGLWHIVSAMISGVGDFLLGHLVFF
jgi:Zn-dependent protease